MSSKRINWESPYGITRGYILGERGQDVHAFTIYAPDDPCNPTKDGTYELRFYGKDGFSGITKSYHNNKAAAMRAALRHLDLGRPRYKWVEDEPFFPGCYIMLDDGKEVMWIGSYRTGGGNTYEVARRWEEGFAFDVKGLSAAKRMAEDHYTANKGGK